MRRLCLLVRAPELGRVKTRLAESIGQASALQAYHELVQRQLRTLTSPESVQRELWWTGRERSGVERWAQQWKAELRAQRGEDLGGRMWHCLHSSQKQAVSACSLVIGADVIGLASPLLEEAWQWLEAHPGGWVFVPSEDGGYGLVGHHSTGSDAPMSLEATPLAGVSWGSASVMAQTRERCRNLALPWTELGSVWDVDTEADWRRFQREIKCSSAEPQLPDQGP